MERVNEFIHEYIPYFFAAAGLSLAGVSPVAGTAITSCSLAYAIGFKWVGHRDAKRAKEIVDGLSTVVNSNAKRLEEAYLEISRLQNDMAMLLASRGMQPSGMAFK